MAFTLDQLRNLENAIASGFTRVREAGREVEYNSVDDMIRLRDRMRAELGQVDNGGITVQTLAHSKGLE